MTRSWSLDAFSSTVQASSRRAFSRDSTASPSLFSMRSTKILTVSPSLTSGAPPPLANSLRAMRPSDLRPTSTTTKSLAMRTMVPLTTVPSKLDEPPSDSSRSAANSALAASFGCLRRALPLAIQNLFLSIPGETLPPVGQPVDPADPVPELHGATRAASAIAAQNRRAAGGDLRPARSKALALDECQSRGEGRIGIHVGGIEKPGIGRGSKRCSRPFAVATVPLRHLGKNARLYSVEALGPQLPIPPLRPDFGAGGHE